MRVRGETHSAAVSATGFNSDETAGTSRRRGCRQDEEGLRNGRVPAGERRVNPELFLMLLNAEPTGN
jgi:hypothetical protein